MSTFEVVCWILTAYLLFVAYTAFDALRTRRRLKERLDDVLDQSTKIQQMTWRLRVEHARFMKRNRGHR